MSTFAVSFYSERILYGVYMETKLFAVAFGRRQFSYIHLCFYSVTQYALWCCEKVTPFIATPRRPPYWMIHCCYQIMSREQKLVQWLVNSLFWSRLSKLITVPDWLYTSSNKVELSFQSFQAPMVREGGGCGKLKFVIPERQLLFF